MASLSRFIFAAVPIACVLVHRSAPGQTLAGKQVSGCYQLTVSEWNPPLGGDKDYHSIPTLIRLDTVAAFRTGRVVEPDIAYPMSRPMPGFPRWEILGDTVHIAWTSGFAATVVRLTAQGQDLGGWAEASSDAIPSGKPNWPRANVVARRTDCAKFAAAAALRVDAPIVLGTAERDLTGDGTPVSLRLVAAGPSVDSLNVTFTVEKAGRVIYRASVRLEGRTEYERTLRRRLGMEYRDWLKSVGTSFFADVKFKKPGALLAWMRESMPLHIAEIPGLIAQQRGAVADSITGADIWNEIERSQVTLFEFSTGGDAVTSIGWSKRDGRFYRLYDCC